MFTNYSFNYLNKNKLLNNLKLLSYVFVNYLTKSKILIITLANQIEKINNKKIEIK